MKTGHVTLTMPIRE